MTAGATALLLVDLQRDYLDRPGLVPVEATLVDHVAVLLAGFRAAGQPVVHVRTLVRSDGSDAMPHWAGRLQCVAGSPGADPPPALVEAAGELVARKQHYRGFADGDLDPWLRSRGVTAVVVAGLYTHACVRETALDAYERGYSVVVADDAVGTDDAVHAERTRAWLEGRAATFLPTEAILADLASAPTPDDAVDRACRAASAAQPDWAVTPLPDRLRVLDTWASVLADRRRELVACLIDEVRKPVRAAEDEVDRALGHIRAAADLVRAGLLDDEHIGDGVDVRHRPVGIVAAVMPWNNPMALPVGKIAPALALGNAVVLKPAPEGARAADLLMASLVVAGCPDGLVSRVDGDGGVGAALVAHSLIDAVAVTGSIATGRSIAATCARLGRPLQAELGGNNAAVVLPDADLDTVMPALVRNAVAYAGQRCTAVRRIVVVEGIVDDVVARLRSAYAALVVGDPADVGTDVGPLISDAAAQRVTRAIDEAIGRGARVVARAPLPAALGPEYVAPVVLTDVERDDPIVQEETFGPVAVLQVAGDLDEAVDLANGVVQGLVQVVCTRDEATAAAVLDRAQAGIVQWGPGIVPVSADAPFGGWKASGFGPPEHGRWDAQFLTRPQARYLPT